MNNFLHKETKFPHDGVIFYNGITVNWQEKSGGEIAFRIQGKNAFDRLTTTVTRLAKATNQDTQSADALKAIELKIVNQLLAHYRPHAMPDRNGYYAASAGVTRRGRLYVRVNNELHNKHSFAGRGCAETSMLRTCQEDRAKEDVQFQALYLMSGMAERQVGGRLKEKKPGHVSCLCGECRQNLRAHTVAARFIMVPTNDGTMELSLNREAKRPSALQPTEAWEIPYEVMYPLPEYKEMEHEKFDVVRQGYAYVTDTKKKVLPLDTGLPEVPADGVVTLTPEVYEKLKSQYESADFSIEALNEHPTWSNINRTMLQLIKKAYAQHPDRSATHNLEITAVLVKYNTGKFYPSIMVNGELWLPSKPPELPIALANAYNQKGISDVYMMPFDDHQIQREIHAIDHGYAGGHKLKMPDPAGLGRLIKNMNTNDNPQLHVVAPNDGKLGDNALAGMSESFSIREMFGPDFSNPKGAKGVVPRR